MKLEFESNDLPFLKKIVFDFNVVGGLNHTQLGQLLAIGGGVRELHN